jgi:secondary thiamine-phosphate synthase enzyme
MPTTTHEVAVTTRGDGDTLDITGDVQSSVSSSGIVDGAAVVFVPGSTAGITTIEHEPGMVSDLRSAMERLVPKGGRYAHNHGGDSNGHAHVRAAIMGPSVAVPVSAGRLTLGTWQQIVLVDFDDRPRTRRIVVQVIG